MTTTADDSLDAAAQLFLQHTTPTPPTTQTKSEPALSQSGSTSTPGIHTSHLTQASGSTTGKKNSPWLGANALCLVTIIYNSKSYQCALLPSRESAESDLANKLCKHPSSRFSQAHQGQAEVAAKRCTTGRGRSFCLLELICCWRTWMLPIW
ncbi:uncharacterized protein UBRO_20859 [Ustilago bromivora]|uniref:Uncharacterized protein n=1 Tax=Ustilago bromivora TaxID=307758 RepID=A0A1K0GAH8_9BASI|nr:uncharacterized protein UBRO_20859 [Ustilago bromivora]